MLSIGRCLGISQLPSAVHHPFGQQAMMRRKALIRRRRNKPLVEVHQLVQIRRPAPPMADDEHRRLFDLRRLDPPPIPQPLRRPHHRIERRHDADQKRHRPADRMNPKAVPRTHRPPRARPHSMPEPRRIPRVGIHVQLRGLGSSWGRRLACHVLVIGRDSSSLVNRCGIALR